MVNTFAKPVSDCANTFVLGGDNHTFVDFDRPVTECVLIVRDQLPRETSHKYRVPPLVLMRFARGGKTSTLARVFDKLKEDASMNPILISFNGNGPGAFKRRDGETHAQSILRLIALQLGDYTQEQALDLVADRDALDRHLGNNNVVLMVDELNTLGVPLDSDAADLLRHLFLDRAGRFLVFTCHFPVSIEAFPGVSCCLRGVATVNMSIASSLSELRGMSTICAGLTEEFAAWYGHIPSLIYVTKNDTGMHGVVTPEMRFTQMNIAVDPSDKLKVLQRFVQELLTGYRDPIVSKYYGALASMDADSLVSYPLCYVKEIFSSLSLNRAVVEILNILGRLETQLSRKHSGLAWECTCQVAIILRMLEAHWGGTSGPFDLVNYGVKPDLAFRTLPDECVTLEDARARMNSMIREYTFPTLIYVVSANACFPEVEGFVVYTSGIADSAKIVGFQMKTSDVKPRSNMNTDVINGGAVLIRGSVNAKKPRDPKAGWRYMTSEEVRRFLGHSLLLAMPRDWLQDP